MIKKFLRMAVLTAAVAMFSFSCNEGGEYEFAPYKGYEWHSPYKGDVLCLWLVSSYDAQLLSKTSGRLLATGEYYTRRGEFPFYDFSFELDSVQYVLDYALFDPQLNMVVYGDSLNATCDTAWVRWSLPFTLVGGNDTE